MKPIIDRVSAVLWCVFLVMLRLDGNSLYAQSGSYHFTTLAGPSADGVQFNVPFGVALDSATNLYVTDSHNHVVRKISPQGTSTILAGALGAPGSSDGVGTAARFNDPHEIAIDGAGNLYLADTQNHTIRKITPTGTVSTLAGLAGVSGSADGVGSNARFYGPEGVAVDANGIIYVCDTGNNTVRKITGSGVVTTLAGLAGTRGSTDGTGSAARFDLLAGLVMDNSGTLLVSDSRNCTIRKITSAGVVTTWVGAGGIVGSLDGAGSGARFNYPSGIKVDGSGTVYVADGLNSTIRRITPTAVVTTLAGAAGATGSADGQGSLARFNNPRGLSLNPSGGIFVADSSGQTIRKVSEDGLVTTMVGQGTGGSNDGVGTAARFQGPEGITVDGSGNVYVSDTGNNTIRKITPSGVVSTIAGLAGFAGSADGVGSAARFDLLAGLTIDNSGVLYV